MENFYQRWGRLTYSSQVSRVVCVALASVGCGVAWTFNGGFSGIDYASCRHYLRWESARTRSIYMLLPPPLFQLLIFVPPIPALHSESLDHWALAGTLVFFNRVDYLTNGETAKSYTVFLTKRNNSPKWPGWLSASKLEAQPKPN